MGKNGGIRAAYDGSAATGSETGHEAEISPEVLGLVSCMGDMTRRTEWSMLY